MKINFKPLFLLAGLGAIAVISSCKKDENSSDPATAVNLYFTDYSGNSVNKIDLMNNPNESTILFENADGIVEPLSVSLTSDGYLIVAEESENKIIKIKNDGTGGIVTLYDSGDGLDGPTAITIDNTTGIIYWCNSGTNQIMKGSDDGADPQATLYSGAAVIDYAYGIGIDKSLGKLYISDFNLGIKVGNLDGTGTMEVLWDSGNFADMGFPSNLFVDGKHGKIYWTDEDTDAIVEAKLDGTGTPLVLFDDTDGVGRADGIGVDYNSQKIYWSETSNNVIARGNLDGTGEREVLVSGVESYGMVLEIK